MHKNTVIISLLSLLVSQGVLSAPNPDENLTYMRPAVVKPVAVAKSEPGFTTNAPGALGEYEELNAEEDAEAAEEALEEVGDELIEPEELNETEEIKDSEVSDVEPKDLKATRSSKVFKRPTDAEVSEEDTIEPESIETEIPAEGAGNVYDKEEVDMDDLDELEGGDFKEFDDYDDDEDYRNDATDDSASEKATDPLVENTEPQESVEEESSPDIISDPKESSEKPKLSYKRPNSEKEGDKTTNEPTEEVPEGTGNSKDEEPKEEPEATPSSEVEPEYTTESKSEDSSNSSTKPEATSDAKPELDYKRPEEGSNGEGNVGVYDSSSSSSPITANETDEPELTYKRPEKKDDRKDAAVKDEPKNSESYMDSFKQWYKKTFNREWSP